MENRGQFCVKINGLGRGCRSSMDGMELDAPSGTNGFIAV